MVVNILVVSVSVVLIAMTGIVVVTIEEVATDVVSVVDRVVSILLNAAENGDRKMINTHKDAGLPFTLFIQLFN